jgi:hypothetical protein
MKKLIGLSLLSLLTVVPMLANDHERGQELRVTSTTCTGVLTTPIPGNLNVPSGAYCGLFMQTVPGNVDIAHGATLHLVASVVAGNVDVDAGGTLWAEISTIGSVNAEGKVHASSTIFVKNVTVIGGGIKIDNAERGGIGGSLTIMGSSDPDMGIWGNPNYVIKGNLTYIGNSGAFWVSNGLTVNGFTTVSFNSGNVTLYNIHTNKVMSCFANAKPPGGGGNTADLGKTGQCASL